MMGLGLWLNSMKGLALLGLAFALSIAGLVALAVFTDGLARGAALFWTGWVGHSALLFALDVWKIWTLEKR